jgi:hypothetical protein
VLSFIEHYRHRLEVLSVNYESVATVEGLLNLLGRLNLTRLTIEHGLDRFWIYWLLDEMREREKWRYEDMLLAFKEMPRERVLGLAKELVLRPVHSARALEQRWSEESEEIEDDSGEA